MDKSKLEWMNLYTHNFDPDAQPKPRELSKEEVRDIYRKRFSEEEVNVILGY